MSSTPTSPRFHALVPCAGTGSRAGTPMPKQYQMVAGQVMVMHTLQALAWMIPGEGALFGLDQLEDAKQWAAG